jgi:hypothetical protein
MTGVDQQWPTARLGPLARLRVLAEGLPGAHLHECVIEAAFAKVWTCVSDLERTTPLVEPDVQSLRVLERSGDDWQVRVRLPRWAGSMPLHLDVTMREGWCWMVSRPQLYVIGIAAEPVPDRPDATVVAQLEGAVLPGRSLARWAAGPVLGISRWRHRLHVPGDLARLAAYVEATP